VVREVITLLVFIVFAWLVPKERVTSNYASGFARMLLAAYFATAFRPRPWRLGRSPGTRRWPRVR